MEKAGVDNWNGQIGADVQSLQVVVASMPVRYSSQRVHIASLAKCKCLVVVRDGCVLGTLTTSNTKMCRRSWSTKKIFIAGPLVWYLA
eukprot:7265819-Karenia_brevis.AAC.1